MKELKDKYKEYNVTFLCPSESLFGEYRLTMEGNGRTLVGEYLLAPKGACGCVRRIGKSENKEDDELLNECFEYFANVILQMKDAAVKKADLIFQERMQEFLYRLYRVPETRNPFGFYMIFVTKNGEDISMVLEIMQKEKGSRELKWFFERDISEKQFEICEKLILHAVGKEFDSFFSQKDFSGAS